MEQLPADTMRALINDTSKSPLELAMLARLLQKELVKPSPAPQLAVSFCSAWATPCRDRKSSPQAPHLGWQQPPSAVLSHASTAQAWGCLSCNPALLPAGSLSSAVWTAAKSAGSCCHMSCQFTVCPAAG